MPWSTPSQSARSGGFSGHAQTCAALATILTRECFHHPKRESPHPSAPLPWAPDTCYSTFSLSSFVCPGHLVRMKGYSAWPVVAGFPD